MGNARLLVVEDDIDIANMLKIYFTGMQYDVDVAHRGRQPTGGDDPVHGPVGKAGCGAAAGACSVERSGLGRLAARGCGV